MGSDGLNGSQEGVYTILMFYHLQGVLCCVEMRF